MAMNVVLFWYGALMSHDGSTDHRRYMSAIARGTGKCINVDVGVLLLLGSRVFLAALKLPFLDRPSVFDHAMPKAHVGVGYFVLAVSIVHSVCHVALGIINSSWEWGFLDWTYVAITGVVLLSVLVLLVAFAHPRMRSSHYERFYIMHMICAALFFLLLSLHGAYFGRLHTYKYITPFVLVYVFDRLYRCYTETKGFIDTSDRASMSFRKSVLKFRLPKPFSYRAGQYAELCFPEISRTQFHPLTIASAPHEDFVTFYVKQVGDWTMALRNLMRTGLSCPEGKRIAYKVRGPFGSPAQHFGRYKRVVFVSGGIGGTPFLSAVNDYHHKVQSSSSPPVTTLEFGSDSFDSTTDAEKGSVNRVHHRDAEDFDKDHLELGITSTGNAGMLTRGPGKALPDHLVSRAAKGSSLEPLSQAHDSFSMQSRNLSEASGIESDPCKTEDSRDGHFQRRSSSIVQIGLPTRGSSTNLLDNSSLSVPTGCWVEPPSLESGKVPGASVVSSTRRTANFELRGICELESLEQEEEDAGDKESHSSKLQRLQFVTGSSTLSYTTMSFAIIRVFLCFLVVLYHIFPENLVASAPETTVQSQFISFTQTPTPFAIVDVLLCVIIFSHTTLVVFLDIWVSVDETSLWLIGVDAFVVLPFLALPIILHALNFNGVVMRNVTGLLLFCMLSIACDFPRLRQHLCVGEPETTFDFFLTTPRSVLSVLLSLSLPATTSFLGVSLPMSLFAALYRHGFTPKSLARCCSSAYREAEFTDGLDFLYITPTSDEDEWLVSELQKWKTSPHFRLHRFLTREAKDEENTDEPMFTNYGRPDFDLVFEHLVRNVDSGTTVGVFFCGPKSMEIAVREACYRIMGRSRRRGRVHGEKRAVPGCNGKLVVRAENFG